MRKKFLVALLALLGTFSVVYAMQSELKADTTSIYYGVGDTFFETDKTTMTIGGLEWEIIAAKDGQGYISTWATEEMLKAACPKDAVGQQVSNKNRIDGETLCINSFQTMYTGFFSDETQMDEIGLWMNKVNSGMFESVNLLSLADLEVIYTDYKSTTEIASWLSDNSASSPYRKHFTLRGASTANAYAPIIKTLYDGENVPVYVLNDSKATARGAALPLQLQFKVALLQKNYIKALISDKTVIESEYNSTMLNAGSTLANLSTSEGEGVFRYSIKSAELTKADGNKSDASSYFKIIADTDEGSSSTSSTGEAKLSISNQVNDANKLKPGTYTIQVKVVDESDNVLLYNGVDDEKRTQEVTIQLTVEKGIPTITFDNNDKGTTTIIGSVADITNHKEHAIHTNTEKAEDVGIVYSYVSGTSGLISAGLPFTSVNAKDEASISIAPNISGTAIIKASIEESEYFKAASTTKTLKVTPILDAIYIEDKSNIKAGTSASKPPVSYTSTNRIGHVTSSGGTSPYTYSLPNEVDNMNFHIDSSGNIYVKTSVGANGLTPKAYNIKIQINDSTEPAQNKTIEQVINIANAEANGIAFDNPANPGTALTSDSYTHIYDPDNLSFNTKLLETTTGSLTGTTLSFESSSTEVIEVRGSGNGTGNNIAVTIKKASGTTNVNNVKITATIKGGIYGSEGVHKELFINIDPCPQTIAFTSTESLVKIAKDQKMKLEAKGSITASGKVGVGGVTYTSSNESIATVDKDGNVIAIAEGTAIITATLNKKDTDTYNENYTSPNCTKNIQVIKGMSLTYSAAAPNLKAGDNKVDDKVGTITIANNDGPIQKYAISDSATGENADASFFRVVGNGLSAQLKLLKPISIADYNSHNGIFKVQVLITDGIGAKSIDIIVNIDKAVNDMYFTDENGNKIEGQKVTKVYGEDNNKFDLTSYSSNTGATKYQPDPSDTSGVVSVTETGEVTILKAGTTKVQAVIEPGSGYEGGTISLDVTVTLGEQNISFTKDITNYQFVEHGKFSASGILKETKNEITSKRAITYEASPSDVCEIDVGGMVEMLKKEVCTITISNKDKNWTEVSKTQKITFYDGMQLSFTQEKTPQAETASAAIDAPIGKLIVAGGMEPITYGISKSSEATNQDADFFKVNESTGTISLKKAITAADLAEKYDKDKKAYVLHVEFTSTDGSKNVANTQDVEVLVTGAPLTDVEIDTDGKGKITKTYAVDGQFQVNLLNNKGNAKETYQLKTMEGDLPQQSISISGEGVVSILNASDKKEAPAYIEAVIPASKGYDAKTINCEVEILKAVQPFKFKDAQIDIALASEADLVVEGILAKDANGNLLDWSLMSMDTGKLKVSNHKVVSGEIEGKVIVKASVEGDRNYQAAVAEMSVNITGEPPYDFIITVPEVTYGDKFDDANPLKPTIFLDRSGDVDKTQVWSSSDPSVATIDENGVITILKVGSTTILCTQSIDGLPDVKSEAVFTVLKKPITIRINDKEKYVGEELPEFDVAIPTDALVGNDTLSTPIFTCKDGVNDVDANTRKGTYTINAFYAENENPNYIINVEVDSGSLLIKQDESINSWYSLHLEKTAQKIESNQWSNDNVKVVLHDEALSYDEISLDKKLWDSEFTKVSEEGIIHHDVFFQKSSSHALATSQPTIIKIDKTKPNIISITGEKVNTDGMEEFLNKITFGTFFKPGVEVEIKSEDKNVNPEVEVSGVASIKYTAYVKKNDAMEIYEEDEFINTSGKVKLDDPGIYRVCASAIDHAGNESEVACSDLNVKKIDVDVDSDDILDFNDSDGDGCPDVNIKWKNEKNEWELRNGDLNEDGVPDINIDSDGDGEVDLNIDTDKDGRPDLNLVILKALDWIPTKCVTNQQEEYCTGTAVSALINIDTGDDGVPDLNIDTDGDMKANINITKDNKEVPTLNIVKGKTTWNPDKNFKYDNFLYDTEYIKPLLNVDMNDDGEADINIDTGDDGIPDLNIDTDGDYDKAELNIDSDGDKKADLNIDFSGNGKAEVNVDVDNNGIPDLFIDGNADGVPDYNLNPDEKGKPTEHIIELSTWKPTIAGSKNGIEFNTMELKEKSELEDNGVKVEKPGSTFLPNYAVKVTDAKDSISEEEKAKIDDYVKEGDEIKDILDVKLYEGNTVIQPDGTLKVKLPVKDSYTGDSIKVIVEQADGTFVQVDAQLVDGYLVYETDFLGKVSVIGEVEDSDSIVDEKEDIDIPDPKGSSETNTSVKGNYTSGIGGAGTGDSTSIMFYICACGISALMVKITRKKLR